MGDTINAKLWGILIKAPESLIEPTEIKGDYYDIWEGNVEYEENDKHRRNNGYR